MNRARRGLFVGITQACFLYTATCLCHLKGVQPTRVCCCTPTVGSVPGMLQPCSGSAMCSEGGVAAPPWPIGHPPNKALFSLLSICMAPGTKHGRELG